VDETGILDGFKITAGYADGSFGHRRNGGGIHLSNSSPRIENCWITGSFAADRGGGVYLAVDEELPSVPIIIRSRIEDNVADQGGGIEIRPEFNADGTIAIVDTTISDNSATVTDGGGIEVVASTMSAPDVVGIVVSNCVFDSNWAEGLGGGIHVSANVDSGRIMLECINSLFVENGAPTANPPQFGGGIYTKGALSTRIVNCTFYGNEAAEAGGALLQLALEDCPSDPAEATEIVNTIMWGNVAPDGHEIAISQDVDMTIDYSNIAGGTADIEGWSGAPCNVWGASNIDPPEDPEFVNAPADLRLACNSPCLEAGNNALVPADTYDVDEDDNDDEPTPDIDRLDRLFDGDADETETVDLGAHEYICLTCPYDVAGGDGLIGFADLLAVLSAWGPCDKCPEDFDESGAVGFADLLVILSNWGPCDEVVCPCDVPTMAELIDASCLTEEDYEDYLDIVENGSEAERENWSCWFAAYIYGNGSCSPSASCPGADPFD
jgi:hypothetical protein